MKFAGVRFARKRFLRFFVAVEALGRSKPIDQSYVNNDGK